MEIEAKYRLMAPIAPTEFEAIPLEPYRLAGRSEHQLYDRLLDTPSRTLASQGFALRLRVDGKRQIATLKQGAPTSPEGVHRREEIECEMDAADVAAGKWPEAIWAVIRSLVVDAPLEPLIEVENTRYTWDVTRADEIVAELALDEGVIRAGGRQEPFRELEIELKNRGSEADLAALATRLRQYLDLAPEPQSKFARGLALLETPAPPANTRGRRRSRSETAVSVTDPVAPEPTADVTAPPVSAGELAPSLADAPALETPGEPMVAPPVIPPAARPLLEQGRAIILRNLDKLAAATPVALAGEDPEGVHQMRVATRRLRAALQILEETVADPRQTRAFRRGLRALANSLGRTRDADVFLMHLEEYARKLPAEESEALGPLRTAMARERERGRKDMIAELQKKTTQRLLKQLRRWAERGAVGHGPHDDLPRPVWVRHFVHSVIWRRYEEVLAYEMALPAPIPVLHQLRIAGKRFRYSLEFFEDALGPEAKGLLKRLTAMQDVLGEIHDADVALAHLDALARQHQGTAALQIYRTYRRHEQNQLVESFPACWEAVTGLDFRQRLSQALAVL